MCRTSLTVTTHVHPRSECAVNIRGVRNPIYQGCYSYEEAVALFDKHLASGDVRSTLPKPKREDDDDTAKAIPPWVELEYAVCLTERKSSSILTSLPAYAHASWPILTDTLHTPL